MKSFISVLLACFFIACTMQKPDTKEKTSISEAKEVTIMPTISKDTIQLTPLETNYIVKVGQTLTYTANVHGSVGETTEVTAPNENTIKLTDTKHKYNHPEKSNMPGGDAATVTYLFDALQTGEGHVIVVDSFRGEIQNTYDFKITVE